MALDPLVYFGSASGLSSDVDWSITSDNAGSDFGSAVAGGGDVNNDNYADIIVGSPEYERYSDRSAIDVPMGSAFVYLGSASGPSVTADSTLNTGGDNEGALFGKSVAFGNFNGDDYSDIIVSASGTVVGGTVYAYLGAGDGISSPADWSVDAVDDGIGSTGFGISIDSAGDVNGDGYDDIIVGAPTYTDYGDQNGAVFLYYGSATVPSSDPDWVNTSPQDYSQFGVSVSGAGDINNDGYADIIVGMSAYLYNDTTEEYGTAVVFYGTDGGLLHTNSWFIDTTAESRMGYAVDGADDVDNDGYDDIVVGAPYWSDGSLREGSVFLYNGAANVLPTASDWEYIADVEGGYFSGGGVAVGDVDGDGYDDLVVGSSEYYEGLDSSNGRVQLFYGTASGIGLTPDEWEVVGEYSDAMMGYSVVIAEINGDIYNDIIIGELGYPNGNGDGAIHIYFGSETGPSSVADATIEGSLGGAEQFGSFISSVGDVNGDDYGDIAVGSYGYSNNQVAEGSVSVFFGSEIGLSSSADWRFESDTASAFLEYSSGGDINSDGYSDIIVFTKYDVYNTMWMFYGSASGPSLTPDWTFDVYDDGGTLNSIAMNGDVNGDGIGDVVASTAYGSKGSLTGYTLVFFGSESGPSASYDQMIPSPLWGGVDSYSIRLFVGDTNGDGYDDAIIGNSDFSQFYSYEIAGAVYMYLGSSSGLSDISEWSFDISGQDSYMGYHVAGGDVNGDSYLDVVVNASYYSTNPSSYTEEGAVFAFYGIEPASEGGDEGDPTPSPTPIIGKAPLFTYTRLGTLGDQETQISLIEREIAEFFVQGSNGMLSRHSIQVRHVRSQDGFVNIIVQSDPIDARLMEGQQERFDLDGDGTDDIIILLEDIAGSQAEFIITMANEIVQEQEDDVVSLEQDNSDDNEEAEVENPVVDENDGGDAENSGEDAINDEENIAGIILNRDLQLGDQGEDVRALQQYLNAHGFVVAETGPGSVGNETIIFGYATQAAVIAFQKANVIVPAIGYVGPITREVMQRDAFTPVTDNVGFTRDLQLGDQGEDVRALQQYLNAHGFVVAETGLGSAGNETDFFGRGTQNALIGFQNDRGIVPAVGYFGLITRAAIQ